MRLPDAQHGLEEGLGDVIIREQLVFLHEEVEALVAPKGSGDDRGLLEEERLDALANLLRALRLLQLAVAVQLIQLVVARPDVEIVFTRIQLVLLDQQADHLDVVVGYCPMKGCGAVVVSVHRFAPMLDQFHGNLGACSVLHSTAQWLIPYFIYARG